MGKIAFVFAGQGSQYVGMGKELYENYEASKNIFDRANEALGFDITKLCFEGPKEEIDKTENTQPCVLTTTIAVLAALKEAGIKADVTAGLSLGEYSALVLSGVLKFEDAVKLVKKRGKFMQEAVPKGVGTMAAVIGLSTDEIIEVCREAKDAGIVEAANLNCPGQIVIAGEVKAVEKACGLAKEKGARRTVGLSVSAPFHTSMLLPAALKLEKELEGINLGKFNIPVITNVTADYVKDVSEVKGLLKKQVMTSVKWEETIRRMINDGVDTFVEIGPGKALSGFVKKIDRSLTMLNVEDIESLNKTVETLRK